MKYKAIVNDHFEFSDLSPEEINLLPVGEDAFHILIKGKSFTAKLLSADWNTRTLQIRINGEVFDVRLEDHYDRLVNQLGLKNNAQQQVKDIKAPMPGLALKLEIEIGQAVEEGDVLLILEAMKMENAIKAPTRAKVKAIHIKQGQAVDKGQLLIEME